MKKLTGSGKRRGSALILVSVLVAFKPKIEAAITQQSKIEPPDEVLRLLDQLYILGVAGGLILADDRDAPSPQSGCTTLE